MKQSISPLWWLGVVLATSPVAAAPVTIGNPSFEIQTPELTSGQWTDNLEPSWKETGGPNNPNAFMEWLNLTGEDGTDTLGMVLGHDVWQDLGDTYQPNTLYTLTVKVGNRNATYTSAGNQSVYGLATTGGILAASTAVDASTFTASGSFSDAPALTFDTYADPCISGPIRVLLQARGTSRTHFDHIRLDAVASVPAGRPAGTLQAVTAITSSGAQFNGTVTDVGSADPAVTFYYDTSDKGGNPAAWTGSVAVPGTQSGAFNASVAGLQPATTYHVRARLTNGSGAVWAAPCASFTTLANPAVVANVAASSVGGSTATVGANVTSTGGAPPDVTIYYGASDGGTTIAAWASSVSIPALNGSATRLLTGLAPATQYFFRAYAVNSGGASWAPVSDTFTTIPVTPPTVENRGTDGVTGTGAEIFGAVTSAGNDPPTVTMYWGTSDGGTIPASWANSRVTGQATGDFSTLLQGLAPLTTYYYTSRAVNAAGTVWATPSRSFTTGTALPTSVIINEINYDPADPTKREEFIEFHNPTASPIDMTGWSLDQGVNFVFPSTTIAPGGYVVVVENAAAFAAKYPAAPAPAGEWQTGNQLSNSGENIRLRDNASNTIDEVNYGVGFPWPTSAKGGASSIELIHPHLNNDLGGSWRSSINAPDTVIIPRGASGWRYRETKSEPPSTWKEFGFDDTGAEWATGTMPMGFIGGTPFSPPVTFGTALGYGGNASDRTRAYYFRKKFTLATPATLSINIRRDDGAVVWINNEATPTVISAETAWNPPFPYTTLAPNATTSVPGLATYATFTIPASKFVAGDNIIAIQLHQSSISSSDLLIDLDLSIPGPKGGSPGTANTNLATVVSDAPPAIRNVVHTPNMPASGQPVVISARITDADNVGTVNLTYQLVNPGSYIRLQDAAYNLPANWTTVAMNDGGIDGDAAAGDGTFSATIPGSVQQHRRLIRYRITAADATAHAVTVPYADDDQPNFAYFCYNGIPDWAGSFRPVSHSGFPVTPVVNYPASLVNSMQALHLIAQDGDVLSCMYTGPGDSTPYRATLVYDGHVYDHITFNVRGIGSTRVSGKNKISLKFNRAHDFHARDNWGRLFNEDWNSFGLDANASPWAGVHRGSAGVEDAVSYRIFELGGMPSLRTTYTQLRIIRKAQESAPAGTSVSDATIGGTVDGQYTSDLWGLYMMLEPTEGNFLDERALPDGNIYAIEGNGGDKKHQGGSQVSDSSDWNSYRTARTAAGQTEPWYRANMDLPNLYTYIGLSRLIGNVDVRDGDNYRYYHRSSDNRWVIMGYDHDMQFIAASHWVSQSLVDGIRSAGVPHSYAAIMRHAPIALEYRNRCRELISLIASDAGNNGGQIGQLLDEYAQMVNPAGQPLTWADIDAAMWNLHPRSAGAAGTNSGQTNHRGNFYRAVFTDARGAGGGSIGSTWIRNLSDPDADGFSDHEGLVQWFKDFATNTYPAVGAGVVPWTRRPTNAGPSAAGSGGDTYVHRQKGYGWKYLEWESLYGGQFNFSTNPPLGVAMGDLTATGVARYVSSGDSLAALSTGNYVLYPDKPVITSTGSAGFPVNDVLLHSSDYRDPNGDAIAAVQFRIGEISAPGIPLYDPSQPRIYEITDVWRSAEIPTASGTGIPDVRVPGSALRSGHTYRARVRHKDSTGRWSFWSEPLQFVTSAPDVSVYASALRISEINYNPGAVTPAESAAPGWNPLWSEQDFEFIELRNVGDVALDLTDIRFTKGIDFDFPPAFTLAAGGNAVVVKNPAAFAIRYPSVTIAGSYGSDSLANRGEELKLSFGAGTPIIQFNYEDAAPWPSSPDGDGPTLVLKTPSKPALDHGDPAEWRASYLPNGQPGDNDFMSYATWALLNAVAGNPGDDADHDGYDNRLEYALMGNPAESSTQRAPVAEFSEVSGLGSDIYALLTFVRREEAPDATFTVQFSTELMTWNIPATLVSSTANGDGTLTEVWRSNAPVSTQNRLFGRVQVSNP
ncbi:MAG: lamin tail domain-containing protein [Verrucomicrobiales bacterium]|nr:lamin tail domain-containing protein [Verrucomicrobiales bacterium]